VPFGLFPFVNAMAGIEYLFLFMFTLVFARWFPGAFREQVSHSIIAQKVISIILVSAGLLLLAL
jgi:hypothetical protein